jgi:hypothetical protein
MYFLNKSVLNFVVNIIVSVVAYVVPPDRAYVDLSILNHRADSVTSSERMIMRVMFGRM